MKLLECKLKTTIFFFAIVGTIFGQKSLSVSYTIESKFDLNEMKHAEAQTMASMAAEIMGDFEFQLLIDDNESIFKQSEQLVRDDIDPLMYKLASGFCSGNEVWYTKTGDSIKRIALLNSQPPVVLTLDEKVQWEITNESKHIGKFKVLKATTTRKLGSYLEEIEAWFAPELPYSFGPIGYNGLPGLILEMNRDKVVYRFKEIEEKTVKINPPKGSKQMTFEEYYEMLETNMAEIKKGG
ncbi:GLPGLI family protein [Muricauda ruestringensis]|uniref:GLPGLI family protein n=2 Tax=Flagellimonas aurea TaxID=2915619 RepID=A0ABS3G4Y9_9FLAO|nr:GLPGLI family protein [Allomuricauda aurea]